MPLQPGARVGAYEILSLIGAGGMGEVYRARDTRLDRTVAIKILLDRLADRPQLRERFEREAKTIASLNHPHICVLHDIGHQDGMDYLVMEYVEGETLAASLTKRPLPVEQVLALAIDIADALDKAHGKGITHRDLKPGNIMLTKSGAKLLDFGLAKLKQSVAPAATLSALPTADDAITAEGTILGTLQYMAPEQVEGKEADARSDIFAFGAVVYEMLTGKRAFEGKSQASVMAKILEHEPPPMSSLQPMTPPALDRVVKRCLAKDPDDRWQTARDLEGELKWIAEGGSQPAIPAANVARRKVTERLAWAVGAVGIIAAVAASVAYFRRDSVEAPSVRFTIGPPENGVFDTDEDFLAVSPDGNRLAFIATDSSGKSRLWIRALGSLIAQPLPGTDGAARPFWSADGRFLAFHADGSLKKIAISGGPAQTLIGGLPSITGGAWSRNDVVLFSRGFRFTIQRVSAAGGAATPVSTVDTSREEAGHFYPHFLPDGKHFLYSAFSPTKPENNAIYVGSLDSKERTLLINAFSNAVYAPPGYLLYHREGTLMAHPFDADRIQLTGEPVSIAEGVEFTANSGRATFRVSESGVLAYRRGVAALLVGVDRRGTEQLLAAPARFYENPRLSSDGRRVVVEVGPAGLDQLWVYDLARDTLTRLTFEGGNNEYPVWTPDGKRIAFQSSRDGIPSKIFWQLADSSGGLERLTSGGEGEQVPSSWSPDGQLLAFDENHPTTLRNIWVFRLSDRKAEPFLRTPFEEGGARFSPDGRWLAYVSNESGRPEVYVQPYPGPGGKWQVSIDGGTEPVWNRNGRELFYRSGNRMMVVETTMQPNFSAGKPRMLFEGPYFTPEFPTMSVSYDVSVDGQRFLMVKQGEQGPPPINVVQNWLSDLKRLVPTR